MQNSNGQAYLLRSLSRLDKEIGQCNSLAERNVLFAKKAVGLARHAYIDEAKVLIVNLRAINLKYDPRLSAWIMFAEGLIEHSETLNNAKSKDKFIRSFLISQVANDRELASASAAWVAHCEFVAGRTKEASEHISKAFEWSTSEHNEARARACMLLADGFNMAGDPISAKSWYQQARAHAVKEGDIAMQNTMLFNTAAYHVAQLTLADCESGTSARDLKIVALEVASASNLNAALGISSLPSMIPIMRAELHVVERLWSEADRIFDQHIPELKSEGQERLLPKMYAQRAWSRANMGNSVGAADDLEVACAHIDQCSDFDDLAVLHFRLAGVGRLLKDEELERHHQAIASGYLEKFQEQQAEVTALFSPVAALALEKIKNPA